LKGKLARIDELQQGKPWLAFPFAVVKKFGDDKAGKLAALIAYYGFISLFPLLLVFVSVLGFVLHDPDLQKDAVDSVLANFPIVGEEISGNVGSLRGSGVVLALGLAGALWGGLAVMQAAQDAMNEVWEVPLKQRPNFLTARLRSVAMLAILGVGIVASTVVAGGATSGAGDSLPLQAAALAVTLAANLGLFLVAFRVLTVRSIAIRDLLPGAVIAAVATAILQALGGYLLGHQIKNAGQTYKDLAFVIVLLSWMALQAQVTLFAAEVNVVRTRQLWPRSLQEPLVAADRQVLTEVAKVAERHPRQQVDVSFDSEAETQPEPDPDTRTPEPERRRGPRRSPS
jgi:YihY family inner membrane protein